MTRKRNKFNSQWVPSYNDQLYIDALEDGKKTCREVTDIVGCTNSLTQMRLKKLHKEGKIQGRKVGNTWMYWQKESATWEG